MLFLMFLKHQNQIPQAFAAVYWSLMIVWVMGAFSLPERVMAAEVNPPSLASGSSAGLIHATEDRIAVQAGTTMTITFNQILDTRSNQTGDPFSATLTKDMLDQTGHVILPRGTFIRGRIGTIDKAKLFSRGGRMDMAFDHVVLSNGELLPIDLSLSTDNASVDKKGVFYMDPGIKKKVHQGVEEGQETFSRITDAGFRSKGAAKIVTVPGSIALGAVAGTAVTTGKAVHAIFGKGDAVTISPKMTIVIRFQEEGIL